MKRLLFILGLILLSAILNAQGPYYFYNHKGEKIYLSLNTEYAFLSLKEQKVPVEIQQHSSVRFADFRSDDSDQKQYQTKKGARRFYTELKLTEKLSDNQYLELLSDMKRQNKNVIISPYFKINGSDIVGLSNFFYVKLKNERDTTLLMQMTKQTGTVIIEQYQFRPLWFLLSTTEDSESNALEYSNLFYESGLFQTAEPDLMVDLLQCVNDTHFNNQWGLRNTGQYGGTNGIDIKACDAWQISTGSNVTVAVIDHGIELDHPDLAANIHPLNFDCQTGTLIEPAPQMVRGSHGVACAGIVGAIQNNSAGISGVAPNCRLMAISHSLTLTANAREQLATGIDWAWRNGADVISNSWGHDALQGQFITEAIDSAVIRGRQGKGCVVVFATGNDNRSSVSYPASLNSVIAVGAISPCGQRKSPTSCDGETNWGSNYGTALDVVAPGVLVPTTDRQGSAGYNPNSHIHTGNRVASDYADQNYTVWFNGTSAATPHVAGIAALILSVRPDLTQAQVRHAIESSCTKLSGYTYSNNSAHTNGTWNNQVGHGLVNAHAALQSLAPHISGSTYPCASDTYRIENLPAHATIQWSTQNGNFEITPLPNQNNAALVQAKKYNVSDVLTANIRYNGTTLLTLNKNISSCKLEIPGINTNKYLSCTPRRFTVPLVEGAYVVWQYSSSIVAVTQQDNYIDIKVEGTTASYLWLRASVIDDATDCELATHQITLSNSNLEGMKIVLLDRRIEEVDGVDRVRYGFRIDTTPEGSGRSDLCFHWSNVDANIGGSPHALMIGSATIETGGETGLFSGCNAISLPATMSLQTTSGSNFPPIGPPDPPIIIIPTDAPDYALVTLPLGNYEGTITCAVKSPCGAGYSATYPLYHSTSPYKVQSNPASNNTLTLEQESGLINTSENVEITLYSSTNPVRSKRASLSEKTVQIDTSGLPNGNYILTITKNNELIQSEIVIIKN